MTKEQRKDIEDFIETDFRIWNRIDRANADVFTERDTFEFIYSRYPELRVKEAYEIIYPHIKGLYYKL